MEQNQLRKLKREQLLKMMLHQQQVIEEQEQKILALEEALNEKKIRLEKAGSIAEAALALNEVFEAAQKAADDYLLSIQSQAQAQA
ncbi:MULTISPECIES: DNA repair protein [unclassified Streptococcus]|uniref:DNA repair protein n=1 Tax=unclassified Streptococcus TaxID=2608887 RepID=UPI00359E073A